MLTDPISSKLGQDVLSLPRISVTGQSAVYADEGFALSSGQQTSTHLGASNDVALTISHQRNKRRRTVVRLNHATGMPSVVSGNPVPTSMSCYLVIDRPVGMYDDTSTETVLNVLLSFLSKDDAGEIVASDALVRVISGEI